ncbi:MAG: hypothetical protein WCI92_19945 [Bacteroidota bacterium]
MTNYDWENIVKNKTIVELQTIIRENILGEQAYDHAKIELEKRQTKGKISELDIIATKKRKIKLISNSIGFYQIFGGILGLLYLISIAISLEFDFQSFIILFAESLLVAFSILAGVSLLKRNKFGVLFSRINQLLQIIFIKTTLFTYYYYSGAAFLIGTSVKNSPILSFESLLSSKFELNWNSESALSVSYFYLNIMALIILYILSRMKSLQLQIKSTNR